MDELEGVVQCRGGIHEHIKQASQSIKQSEATQSKGHMFSGRGEGPGPCLSAGILGTRTDGEWRYAI